MTKNSKVANAQRSKRGNCIRDLTISLIGAGNQRYAMFELVELNHKGALLGGSLLLEKGESLVLEIAGPRAQVRSMHAQVVEVILSKETMSGNSSGVRIKWSELSGDDQKYLARINQES